MRKAPSRPLLLAKADTVQYSQLQQGLPCPASLVQPSYGVASTLAQRGCEDECFDVARNQVVPPFMHMEDYYIRECLNQSSHPTIGFKSEAASLHTPCVIPSPPVMPIINPVVYTNNQDIGTGDLQYISDEMFAVINLHQRPDILIPRMTEPSASSGIVPSLIPSQEPQVEMHRKENANGVESESPISMASNSYGVPKSNKNKLLVLGFSWYTETKAIDCGSDIWLRK